MDIVTIQCPSCGGSIQMDSSLEFGFCTYCGTKIYVPNAIQKIRGTVQIDRSGEAENLLRRARSFFDRVDYRKAREYYERVLDIDCDNEEAADAINRINHSVVFHNKMSNTFATFVIDGKRGSLRPGNRIAMEFADGFHSVRWKLMGAMGYKDWRVHIGMKPKCYEVVIEPIGSNAAKAVTDEY